MLIKNKTFYYVSLLFIFLIVIFFTYISYLKNSNKIQLISYTSDGNIFNIDKKNNIYFYTLNNEEKFFQFYDAYDKICLKLKSKKSIKVSFTEVIDNCKNDLGLYKIKVSSKDKAFISGIYLFKEKIKKNKNLIVFPFSNMYSLMTIHPQLSDKKRENYETIHEIKNLPIITYTNTIPYFYEKTGHHVVEGTIIKYYELIADLLVNYDVISDLALNEINFGDYDTIILLPGSEYLSNKLKNKILNSLENNQGNKIKILNMDGENYLHSFSQKSSLLKFNKKNFIKNNFKFEKYFEEVNDKNIKCTVNDIKEIKFIIKNIYITSKKFKHFKNGYLKCDNNIKLPFATISFFKNGEIINLASKETLILKENRKILKSLLLKASNE